MRFKALNTAALTAGALVPDIEPLVYNILGVYPDRLMLHSLAGALSVDILLSLVILKMLSYARIERIGVNGLDKLDLFGMPVVFSAAVGSLSHVLVDSLHHDHNPLFWPFEPVYFTGPLVTAVGNPLATNLMSIVALTMIFFIVRKIMKKEGSGLALFFTNPIKAVSLLTNALRD